MGFLLNSPSDEEAKVVKPIEIVYENEQYSDEIEEEISVVEPEVTGKKYLVKSGDTLSSVCEEHDISIGLANKLDQTLGELAGGRFYLRPGQEVAITQIGEVTTFELLEPPTTSYLVSLRGSEITDYKKIEATRFSQPVVAIGEISSSLFEAGQRLDVSVDTLDEFVDLFGSKVNFERDIRVGDSFTIIYQEKQLASGEQVGTGPILAAKLVVQGQELIAVRFVGVDGTARHFNSEGEFLGSAFLRYPVKFSRISSSFSKSRFHPVLKKYKPHNGVDFAAPVGTPVRAAADGIVQFAGRKGAAGKMVKLSHGKKYQTAYLHLNSISVKGGKKVSRGDVIGTVGQTGRATGPHLHYSFYINGKYVDPMKIDLPAFEALSPENTVTKKYLKSALLSLERYESLQLSS